MSQTSLSEESSQSQPSLRKMTKDCAGSVLIATAILAVIALFLTGLSAGIYHLALMISKMNGLFEGGYPWAYRAGLITTELLVSAIGLCISTKIFDAGNMVKPEWIYGSITLTVVQIIAVSMGLSVAMTEESATELTIAQGAVMGYWLVGIVTSIVGLIVAFITILFILDKNEGNKAKS